MTMTLAECGSDIQQLAQLGWPGVAALAVVCAALVGIIWAMNR